jgi:SAM-dependent MidA family methyltransferase
MERGPGLRRVAGTDLDAVEGDPRLVERVRAAIAGDGPLTFARFMEIALYDPDGGYYRGPLARPGRGGDFLTAPEAHPIFGRALARHVDDVWRALEEPAAFSIREHGAGGGALAVAILEGLAAEGSALANLVRYRLVDAEPKRVEEARTRLEAAGLGDRVEADDGQPIAGIVIANEVLDALPTHRVVRRGDRTLEVFVGLGGDGFVDVEAEPSTPALEERLRIEGVELADGQRGEVCLALDGWVAGAAAGLSRGVLLLIDYGYPAAELYDLRRRREGTAMAYLGHVAHDDLYRAVGRQDLTAHVDVTAVERAATGAGLATVGMTTQGPFLAALGAGELLMEMQGSDADLGAYLEARAALVRMIDPAAMGGFRVMAFGRDLPAGVRLRGLG